jgi:thymidylate kinase
LAPDCTLFLKIEPKVAAQRMRIRPQAELYEALETQERVAKNYEYAIALRRQAGESIVCLDGGLPKEELSQYIEGELFRHS